MPNRVAMMLLTAGALVAIAAIATPTDPQAQKPIIEGDIFEDGEGPPATPDLMLRAADAVLVGRYNGNHRPRKRTGVYANSTPATLYTFEILEVLKYNPLLPPGVDARIELSILGGDVEYPTYIERSRLVETRPFVSDHEYVVFLARNGVRPELYVPWRGSSFFDITSRRVQALDLERQRHDGMLVETFLDILRRAPQ